MHPLQPAFRLPLLLGLLVATSAPAGGPELLERAAWWPFESGPVHGLLSPAETTGPRAIRLPAAAFDPRRGEPALPPELRMSAAEAAREGQPWLVQVSWPVPADARRRLEEAGASVLAFVPNAAYVVRPRDPSAVAALPGVLWASPLHPAWRLDPAIGLAPTRDREAAAGRSFPLRALLFDDASKARVVLALEALGARIDEAATWDPKDRAGRVYFRATPLVLLEAARLPGLRYLEELNLSGTAFAVETKPAIQSGAVLGGTPYHDAGLMGAGQVIGIADSGLDVDTILLSDTELDAGAVGPAHRKVISYTAIGGGDLMTCSGTTGYAHGTNVTQNALGNRSDFGLDPNLDGIAPAARVVFFDMQAVNGFACGFGLLNPPASLTPSFADTLAAGGRLFNGSFGLGNGYNNHSTDADQFLWDNREAMWIFAAGNGGGIGSPATAKNVVAAGGYYQDPFFDFFGSNGPGPDGRMAPTVMAPACDNPNGNAAPFDFDTAASVSNDDGDFTGPPTSTVNQGTCGTSFASPFTAGAAALVRDYFEQGFHPGGAASAADAVAPSGALVKAVLLNSGEFLPCGACGGVRMAGTQGMGRLNLSLSLHLAGDGRTVPALRAVDRGLVDGLATGGSHVEVVTVTDASVPLRATVAWVDVPQSALVNDLRLVVTGPGGAPDVTYFGNNFTGEWSDSEAAGGTRDDRANVFESVLIEPARLVPGDWTVTVEGTSVPMGDPRFGETQPFALVVSGGFGVAPASETDCGNGIDDDADGDLDCLDADCAGDPACTETLCCDGLDDDGDGLIDGDDPDCARAPPCSELSCDDGLDDDGDGDVDCADADCAADPVCIESDCCDGLDDDGDGLIDFDDPDCAAAPPCSELSCDDGVDDDGDGDVDCADADCLVDADGDGAMAAPCGTDCDDGDPGSLQPAAAVTGLLWSLADTLAWDDQAASAGSGTTYRVVRGRLDELPVGSGAAESCLDPALTLAELRDASPPPAANGWWYLASAGNSCSATGTGWSSDSLGTPRAPTACP